MRSPTLALIVLGLMAGTAGVARAQTDMSFSDTLHGVADLRLTGASGEQGWLDGGFGKTFAAGDKLEPRLAEASLQWRPRLGFGVSGFVTVQVQPDVSPALDVGEAYLQFRAPPSPLGRLSARAGVFYPPVSMEHDGVAWTTPDMLSASALNTWIGEEVKVAGLEGSWRRDLGAHEVTATAAVFGWNDTAGTLLSFRGWALDGVKTGINTHFKLPPLSPYMQTRQATVTDPFYELDNRAGYYGRLEWRPPAPVAFNALYYDNVGNRVGVENLQWAWETRFLNLGARWQVNDSVTLTAQAMNGETLMGFRTPGGYWVDMGFQSAFVLAQKASGANMFSGRVDWFDTNDRTLQSIDDNNEQGWAVTAAWRRTLSPHAALIVEAQQVRSDRPARVLAGVTPRQDQTVLQAALRLGF